MRAYLFALGLLTASPAVGQIRTVPTQPASEAEALRGVDVFLLNEGDAAVDDPGPRQIEITAIDGTRLILERTPAPSRMIAPGAFLKARYVPVGIARSATATAQSTNAASGRALDTPRSSDGETSFARGAGVGSAFVDRFSPHEPIYGVVGGGDAGAKLQMSFAFRPFAEEAPLKLGNLRFAYTQTMFWALDQVSGPMRSTIYTPEIFAEAPIDSSAQIAFGYRHSSNGRGIPGSIDVNTIFLRATKSFALSDRWAIDVSPEAWAYVSELNQARDVRAYQGYTSLRLALRQEAGLKLQVTGRGNFRTKRGSAELFASYPLAPLGGLGIYVFGQAFTGYGEALDDFNRRSTHARVGIALTR